jgi:hypothetical protein
MSPLAMLRRAAALLLTVAAARAETPHLGFKAGVPLTQYFETGNSGARYSSAEYSAATRRYTAGIAVEWGPAPRLGFELDVLYRRMGYVAIVNQFSLSGVETRSAIDVKGNSWDFPLLAKYCFGRKVRPCLAGGAALRYIGPVRGTGEISTHDLIAGTTTTRPLDTSEPSELRKRFYPGLTAAAGVELRHGPLRFGPEIRYTHWTANISGSGGVLRFAPDQVEILLGILF